MPNAAWDNHIVEYDPAVPLDSLLAHGRNPKVHPRQQTDALKGILGDVGWLTGLIVNQTTGNLLDGHDRVKAAMEAGQQTAPVFYVAVPEDLEPTILLTFDPVGYMAGHDAAIVASLLEDVRTGDAAVAAMLAEQAVDLGLFTDLPAAGLATEPDAPAPLTRADVPDALLPTDNDWGVPVLDLKRQATAVDLPWVKWGTVARTQKQRGTYHFYTSDYKFTALWDDPAPVVNSGVINVVEPNFSTNPQMPRAVVLWHVYRKRWLARWWQDQGVRVLVDLCVEPAFAEMNLWGVPRGWRAYATRGYTDLLADTEAEYARAVAHAESDDLLFVVYGGGRPHQALCQARGWVWVPEDSDAKRGRYSDG